MKKQISLLSIFLIVQGFMASHAMAFGRIPLNSCLALFPQGARGPILASAVQGLLEQNNPLAIRSYQVLSKFDLPSASIERFRKLSVVQSPRQSMIFAAIETLTQRQDQVLPSLRLVYSEISRSWLELWIAQADRNQDIRPLLDFPHKMIRMFVQAASSGSKVLIQKQRLEAFAELLNELNANLRSSETLDISLQDLMHAVLKKPNPHRKLTKLEQHLLLLSKSRREEFLKSCLP